MVPREGIEPSTSPLPRVRSTTEPPRHVIFKEPQAGKPATAFLPSAMAGKQDGEVCYRVVTFAHSVLLAHLRELMMQAIIFSLPCHAQFAYSLLVFKNKKIW